MPSGMRKRVLSATGTLWTSPAACLSAVMLLFCVCSFAQPVLQPPAAPVPTNSGQIEFEKPVYDFGRVKSGDLLNYSFIFTNTGTSTLRITHVQPSCGCTAAR